MKSKIRFHWLLGFFSLMLGGPIVVAQQHTYTSVLSEHTWYKLSVSHEGVYKLDYEAFRRMGVDLSALNPNQIRLFGNLSGALPELNSDPRPDDLTEMAIYVSGAEDGVFDAEDYVLFYGQEPTRWNLVATGSSYQYERDRNYYTDTTYYFLCVDGGVEGLRISEKASLPVEEATTIVTEFPDFWWHEEERISPYYQSRNWYGETVTETDPELELAIAFPYLVQNKNMKVKMSVLGRCKPGPMVYNMRIGNNLLVSDGKISAYGSNTYGVTADTERTFLLDGDAATFKLQYVSGSSGSLLFLDYLELYAWRQLIRVGDFFPFRMFPDQFVTNSTSAVWVQNMGSGFWLWDVSNPLAPQRQEGVLSAGNFVFAVDEAVERRYVMFNPAAASEVAYWTALPNQNLHSIDAADMLIISSPLFLEQARQLADFHEEHDGLHCVVVDVHEIYNEFSTGIPDPAAVRDFIRMVYRRTGSRMKYVTLFGRASFDYRDLLGTDRNFVPCYEAKLNSHREMNTGTDDFFGMMDNNEGQNCSGRVDIGIGRLPVSTMEEAESVVNKIRKYYDLAATHGDWKTNVLFLSDDEVSDYVTNNETYAEMLDTIVPSLNALKLYCGAYPHVNTSTGVTIPQANADLMRTLSDGVFMLCYSGHGGVKGLTGDNVFTTSHINALQNHEKMPFVFTATCEFSKYDNPLLVSAGEQMFLLPDGGTVAMLTTVRPTIGTNNAKLGKALMNVLMRKDEDGKLKRIGDVIRLTKSNSANFVSSTVSINLNFVYLGDPALRLAFPEEDAVALKINGTNANNVGIMLNAMSMVTIDGEIRTADGCLDPNFNGELWVRLYDKKTPFDVEFVSTSANGPYVYYETFSHHCEIIYRGRASVEAGKFSLSFQVPKDINLEYGQPRLEFYAYDSVRAKEAIGKFDNLILGGVDAAAVLDDEGPEISLYWNTPDFVNGSVVERQGVLYADLYDAQGLYHYDYSLGRNITMNSNWQACNNLVLNDRFEPALDDFRRGRIAIPIEGLTPGTYEFTLKAWDTQDNSSEARLWLVVDDGMFLSQVWNFPNPFSDETTFHFAHNGEDGDFRVDLEVFDVLGRHVAQLSQTVTVDNGVMTPVKWNGYDYEGKPLRSGIYLYRFTFTDENGYSRTVSQKMIVTR